MNYNIKRVGHLIKNELLQKWKILGIIITISFLVLIFYFFNRDFSLMSLLSGGNTFFPNNPNLLVTTSSDIFKFHFTWLPQLLSITPCLLTSLAFSEYANQESATFHLSTPATHVEKWSAKAFLYIIALPIVLILLYQIFISLSEIWPNSHAAKQISVNIFDPYLPSFYNNTIIFQCFIFAGALIYKKYSILKILLLGMAIYFICNFISIAALVIISEDINLFKNGSAQDIVSVDKVISNGGFITHKSVSTSIWGFYGLLVGAIVSLIYSYLRYQELEA